MFLKRIQVPDFRVLKDVDITFEPEFSPSIFPLGSLNGGGKSTLLQLIFVLLSCSSDPEKHFFIQNMLEGFDIEEKTQKILASIYLFERNSSRDIELSFICCHNIIFPDENKKHDFYKSKNLFIICNFINVSNLKQEYVLLCKSKQLNLNEITTTLKQLSSKVFLAAPFTQVFLFLPKEKTKLLFDEHKKAMYYSILEESKRDLPNLFTYEILSVDYIVNFFKAARDDDFKQAIETGEYGDSYQNILKELNLLLGNKKININTDLFGVNFKIEQDGKTRELYPEDLSHGELKRLSIYVWLKYKEIQDSIVLIDEIENAFHPDWQYQIISDLAEWGKSNQYILATHSYELCQALTPAHVKELEPKLLPEN